MRIKRASLSPGEPDIISTMTYLSDLRRARDQYQLSLTYEMKLFLIRETKLSPDHQDIAASLSEIGECYEHLNQLKMALEYYKRALLIYEQRPSDSFQRLNMENNIERLSTALND